MRRFVYQLVERLADPAARLSRNRQFALLSTPAGHRALRLYRHLASLAGDFSRHRAEASLTVQELPEGRLEVRVEIPSLHLVRTALLTPDDVGVLGRLGGPLSEALAPRLRGA